MAAINIQTTRIEIIRKVFLDFFFSCLRKSFLFIKIVSIADSFTTWKLVFMSLIALLSDIIFDIAIGIPEKPKDNRYEYYWNLSNNEGFAEGEIFSV